MRRYDDWLATDPRDLEPQEEEHEEYPEQCDACGDDGDLVVLDPERAHMHQLEQVCHECNAAMIAEEDEER